ncbi:MAG: long-chain fatty acid--CoA ligase [Acidobacteriota bacterium]
MAELELDDLPHEPSVPVADDTLRTLGDLLIARAKATPDTAACYHKAGGSWRKMTWSEMHRSACAVARGLAGLGVEAGDCVAILGPTSMEWTVYDFGGQMAGASTVGIFPQQSADQIRYLLEHSESKVAFVANDVEMETLLEAAADLPSLRAIVAWTTELEGKWRDRDGRITGPGAFAGEPMPADDVDARQAACDPEGAAILVYTSGTTGPPKGAMISHRNILALARGIQDVFTFYRDDLLVAFLPMAHVTERCLAFYGRVSAGVPAAYATSIGAVIDELPIIRPTVFGSVPRIFEKLYARVQSEVAKSSPAKQKIFAWADGVARRRLRRRLDGQAPSGWLDAQYKIASKLVFAKIKARFGSRVRVCITGAAPIAAEILEFLWAIEMPILEAYGMTEATVVTHVNRLDHFKLGTVGRVIPMMECRIADDGEILVRGPMVFKGYLKNPEATASTVIDGWLHTGDIGTLDDEGFLRITDRKKHLIITAGGKNVAPANIERAVKNQSPMISQVHAHGDRRPYVCALIAPSPVETLEWGEQNGLLDAERVAELTRELLANPSARSDSLNAAMGTVTGDRRFQELFRDSVRRGNEQLARVEKVRRYFLLDRDFSIEGGEMTPTMKMKRKAIEEKYADRFERVYSEPDFALDAEPKS